MSFKGSDAIWCYLWACIIESDTEQPVPLQYLLLAISDVECDRIALTFMKSVVSIVNT